MQYQSKVVVITGASGGIGRQLAIQCARRGDRVTLASRRSELLEPVAAECREAGSCALAAPTDVADPLACKNLIEGTVQTFGGIDMLIINAGIGKALSFGAIDNFDLLERFIRVNCCGGAYCTYYALPHLKKTRGRIVAVSSLAALTGVPLMAAYAASKHAQAGLFDSLRIELASSGVSVTVIYPDTVLTEGYRKSMGMESGSKETAGGKNYMSAEECARLVLWAAERRKRALIASRRGRILRAVQFIAPGFIDRIAQRHVQRICR